MLTFYKDIKILTENHKKLMLQTLTYATHTKAKVATMPSMQPLAATNSRKPTKRGILSSRPTSRHTDGGWCRAGTYPCRTHLQRLYSEDLAGKRFV